MYTSTKECMYTCTTEVAKIYSISSHGDIDSAKCTYCISRNLLVVKKFSWLAANHRNLTHVIKQQRIIIMLTSFTPIQQVVL